MNKIILSFLCLILLSACDFSSVLELVYYKRVKFSFIDDDKKSKYVYLCQKGENENETKKRAALANQFFLTGINKLAQDYSDTLIQQIEAEVKNEDGNNDKKEKEESNTLAATLKLTKQSEKLALALEDKFQCLLIDSIDLE